MVAFVFRNAAAEIDPGYRTLFMQEMIRNGVLFQGVFVPCFMHNNEEINQFVNAFEHSCHTYKQALQRDLTDLLIGEPAKPVFRKFL
jgi:hypothetical protein